MAAVTYSDGTPKQLSRDGESDLVLWISPSTMDSNDTVDPPAKTGRTIRVLSCHDATTGDAVTASISSGTITIDAAGGTTNHTYHLLFCYV